MSNDNKLWAGMFASGTSKTADDFNSSLPFDRKLYREDIKGSLAHASMLCAQGIISKNDYDKIIAGLNTILSSLESGALQFDYSFEDIHSFVETKLTELIGESGKVLHTARSRNDQVALDLRLWTLSQTDIIIEKLKKLIAVITEQAEKNIDSIAPGYTHLQRAQPISFGHHLMAYSYMLLRDIDRFVDCKKRIKISPLGSCALAGTTYNTNRFAAADTLGFDKPCENSIDGVSDRDFALEMLFCISTLMMHISRFSEEIILWSSHEFRFVDLSFEFSTGSSIMPQKKNPDMAELARGKTGRVYGDLFTLLTVMKGLPLAYNKDMQEDKEPLFDAAETVISCLDVFIPMISTAVFNPESMRKAASKGFINATDCADYLTKKGLQFRNSYKISGEIVRYCTANGKTLEEMTLEEYKSFSPFFEDDIYKAINLEECANKRNSYGGASKDSVKKQIEDVRKRICHD